MARIKIEEIIDHLSSDMRRALEESVNKTCGVDVNGQELFRAFKRALGRRFSTWENVPDQYVDK